jgi:hypothetical protein
MKIIVDKITIDGDSRTVGSSEVVEIASTKIGKILQECNVIDEAQLVTVLAIQELFTQWDKNDPPTREDIESIVFRDETSPPPSKRLDVHRNVITSLQKISTPLRKQSHDRLCQDLANTIEKCIAQCKENIEHHKNKDDLIDRAIEVFKLLGEKRKYIFGFLVAALFGYEEKELNNIYKTQIVVKFLYELFSQDKEIGRIFKQLCKNNLLTIRPSTVEELYEFVLIHNQHELRLSNLIIPAKSWTDFSWDDFRMGIAHTKSIVTTLRTHYQYCVEDNIYNYIVKTIGEDTEFGDRFRLLYMDAERLIKIERNTKTHAEEVSFNIIIREGNKTPERFSHLIRVKLPPGEPDLDITQFEIDIDPIGMSQIRDCVFRVFPQYLQTLQRRMGP